MKFFATEKVYSLDQMYRFSADIGIPDSNSLVLEYSNGGDTTFLPVMVPRVPTGFWISYSGICRTVSGGHAQTVSISVDCDKQDINSKLEVSSQQKHMTASRTILIILHLQWSS